MTVPVEERGYDLNASGGEVAPLACLECLTTGQRTPNANVLTSGEAARVAMAELIQLVIKDMPVKRWPEIWTNSRLVGDSN